MRERINEALEAIYQAVDQLDALAQQFLNDSEYDYFENAYILAVKSEAALETAARAWCDNSSECYRMTLHGHNRMRIEGA